VTVLSQASPGGAGNNYEDDLDPTGFEINSTGGPVDTNENNSSGSTAWSTNWFAQVLESGGGGSDSKVKFDDELEVKSKGGTNGDFARVSRVVPLAGHASAAVQIVTQEEVKLAGGSVLFQARYSSSAPWTTLYTFSDNDDESDFGSQTLSSATLGGALTATAEIRFQATSDGGGESKLKLSLVTVNGTVVGEPALTTSLSAYPSLVGDGDILTVEVELGADQVGVNGVIPTNFVPDLSNANGATLTAQSGPVPATANIAAGSSQIFTYTFLVNTSSATAPGSFQFDASGSGDAGSTLWAAATSNSVLVSPPLTYNVLIGSAFTGVIPNIASISDTSGIIPPTDSNEVETTVVGFTIGDFVWIDSNGNGVQDSGEAGLNGVTVNLLDSSGNPTGMTTTTVNNGTNDGAYEFTGVLAGDYIVEFVPTGSYVFSPKDNSTSGTPDADDSDADPTTGWTDVFTVGTVDNLTIDAGMYVPVSISGLVQYDNGAGVQPISGVTLTLKNAGGNDIDSDGNPGNGVQPTTTTTLANGSYSFAGLPPGTYQVVQTQPVGYQSTSDTDGANNNVIGDQTSITLTSGQSSTGNNFLEQQLRNVSGTVWNDANNSAAGTFTNIFTTGEVGTNATTLNAILVDSSGNVGATTPVAANGTYSFANVTPAAGYTIRLATSTGTVGQPAPTAGIPAGWLNTSPTAYTAFDVITTDVTGKDFGIQQPPVATELTEASQLNPGGTNEVTVPALVGTDPEDGSLSTFIIKTLPTNGTLSYDGVPVTVGQTITSYDPAKLTVDPDDGDVTVVFTYATVDGAGAESPAESVTMPFTGLSIAGNVLNDADGLEDTTVNGTGTNIGGVLYANLIEGGNVAQVVAVANDGTYIFDAVTPNTNYSVVLSTTQGTVGNAAPAPALPVGWVNTGENLGAGAGDDSLVNGILAVPVVTGNVTLANLGIQQPPVATELTEASQLNPGGTNEVTVPALVGTDPEDGSLSTFIIKTLPTNGTLSYDGVPVTVGQTITSYDPAKLTVDPDDGDVTVVFTYATVDGAGAESPAESVTMPFTGLSIAGNVLNDADGLEDTTVNGTGTNIGGVLYANLIEGGNVAQVVAVANDGTYIFDAVTPNTNYSVVLSTTQGTVGNAAPAPALPVGWVNTGENLGAGAGDDGAVNGILAVPVVTGNVTQANLGIQQSAMIAGNVFEDLNGLDDNTVNGIGTNAGGIHVNLVNPVDNKVIASIPVNVDGTYSFGPNDGVESFTDYLVIVTPAEVTVGNPLTSSTLPVPWASTGENLGAGPGSDGVPNGILAVSTTTGAVENANFGIVKVCDLTPTITAVPNVMNGPVDFNIRVQVVELYQVDTEGTIVVRVPRDNRWTLRVPYETNLTQLDGFPMENAKWTFSQTGSEYIFTSANPSVIVPAGGFSYLGLKATWNSGQTEGQFTLSVQIVAGSGGEVRFSNNNDAEKLDFFIE